MTKHQTFAQDRAEIVAMTRRGVLGGAAALGIAGASGAAHAQAKKEVVLLVYGAEDHGLRQKANQIDYHRRIMAWFGHYLKGEPAQPWISTGVSFLDRDKTLTRSGS